MNEFAAIARLFAPLAAAEPGALGLLDDAALVTVAPGTQLVITKDVIVSGVHYLPDDPASLIARKLLRVNLSDLAAMGARPRAYLLGLALTKPVSESWMEGFAAGLAEDQESFGVTLIGGDTTAYDGPTVLSLTALGEVDLGRELRRGSAAVGDRIWVSGTIGDSALGLRALRGGLASSSDADRAILADRYHLPRPRVDLGQRLAGMAHAAIDVSDGLLADLGHICATSGLGAAVRIQAIPLSAPAHTAVALDSALMDDVLAGGDDYELLFTAPADADVELQALSRSLDLALTPIGIMQAGRTLRLLDRDGTPCPLPKRTGWTHF